MDTGFVIALINKRDRYHKQARILADQYDGQPMLITDAILLEIGNALARGFKAEASEIIANFLISDEVKVIRLSPQLFDEAFALYQKYRDKEWSLVDCVSFIVMRQENSKQALTFDRHFIQAGFEVLTRLFR
jgi:predicted nucleic acid-binding protein